MIEAAAPLQRMPMSVEQRRAALSAGIAAELHNGWRVESQTDFQAVMVRGHRVNHVLHLILSVLTLGLWLIVWLFLGLAGGEKREIVSVDEYGQVRAQRT
jgi:hypothetical protein